MAKLAKITRWSAAPQGDYSRQDCQLVVKSPARTGCGMLSCAVEEWGFASGKSVHDPKYIIFDVMGKWVTFWKNIL
jgi:hypothetical protein